MSYAFSLLALCGVLFLGILISYELGRWLARRRIGIEPSTTGVIDAAVFALLGLLVAFTFSGAAGRFDARKQLIIDETNAIGTAYLRIDLLPAAAQPALRASFREYVDSRIEIYRRLPDVEAAYTELAHASVVQRDIWRQAMAASRDATPSATILVVNALNPMFDIATTRTLTVEIHPPATIFAMLAALIVISGLLAGHNMGLVRRSWLHTIGLAVTLTITFYVILDLEYPRRGLLRVDAFDHALVELRQTMQ